MKRGSIQVVAIFVLIFILLYMQPVYAAGTASGTDKSQYGDYLKSVMDMIQERYKGEVDSEKLLEGALKGMFDTMDPYTVYYTAEEANSFMDSINGSYEGIGVTVTKNGDYVKIESVFKSSPAEKSGIVAGDEIAEVDGKDVKGKSVEEVVGLIKGKAGTKVILGVLKNSDNKVRQVEVVRDQVEISPVSYKIDGSIGYIKIDMFSQTLNDGLTEALKELDNKNIKKIILDLRDNPGGDVSQAVAVAKKFVPEGLITKLDFKSEAVTDQEYYSNLKELKYKVAVLVNKNSASASEILAGAIQDTKAGTLIGTKTFGKAKVQNLYPILTPEAYKKYETQLGAKVVNAEELMNKYNISPNDDEIMGWTKITTGLYTTPKGRMIDLVGLTPDILVEDDGKINDVDIDSVSKLNKTEKLKLNSESAEVMNAEKLLKIMGYKVNTPDQKFDSTTQEAITKFQKDNGLFAYGILDFTTQQKLNDRFDQMDVSSDRQYMKAVEVLNKAS